MDTSLKGRPRRQKSEVPAYFWTYGDMMTLLLTFFILLQACSPERNPRALRQAADSFDQNIKTLGLLPLIAGGAKPIVAMSPTVKHPTPRDTQPPEDRTRPKTQPPLHLPHPPVAIERPRSKLPLVFSAEFSDGRLTEEGRRRVREWGTGLSGLNPNTVVIRYYGERTHKVGPRLMATWATRAADVVQCLVQHCHWPRSRIRCVGCPPERSKAGLVECVLVPEDQQDNLVPPWPTGRHGAGLTKRCRWSSTASQPLRSAPAYSAASGSPNGSTHLSFARP